MTNVLYTDGFEAHADPEGMFRLTPEQLEYAKGRFWAEVQAREYERAGLQCDWGLPKYRTRTYTVPDGELLAG